MEKLIFLDTETTGLDPKLNDPVQISFMFRVDGVYSQLYNFFCRPYSLDNISPEALKINGFTIEQLKELPEPKLVFEKILTIFKRRTFTSCPEDKSSFTLVGHNPNFDWDMLEEFFKKSGDNYLRDNGSRWGLERFIGRRKIDTGAPFTFLKATNKLKIKDCKLGTLAQHYKIAHVPHKADSDVLVVKELFEMYEKHMLKGDKL